MRQRSIRSVQELGTAIRDARLDRGLTQAELARRSGVSREWIVGVERGRRPRAELSRVLAVLSALDEPLAMGSPAPTSDRGGPRPAGEFRTPSTNEATQKAIDGIRSSVSKTIDPDVLKQAFAGPQIAAMRAATAGVTTALRHALDSTERTRNAGTLTPEAKENPR
jgi:transcriptional regulator with XRE-family HTH domain